MKKVYIEPAWKLAMSYQEMIANPPQGYQFCTHQGAVDSAVKQAVRMRSIYGLRSQLQKWGVPINLLKSEVGRFSSVPPETDLTLAACHLVFRKEAWILDLQTELPAILTGTEWHFPRYKGIVKRMILSRYCKKVITHVETGKRALVESLAGNQEMESKIDVVYPAVSKKEFAKENSGGRVRLLFVNSGNLPGQFDVKGGKESLAAFAALQKRYPNLELIIRSDVPAPVKARFHDLPGVIFIEEILPWAELERLFQTADIFLFPTHITPSMVFLDAMSYELPVVTTNVWGNYELVEDGRTGFLVPKSSLAPDFLPGAPYGRTRDFDEKVVRQVDPKIVEALVQKLSILIENPELRQRLGRAGRLEVEKGKFSLATRKQAFKCILDEATQAKNWEN